MIQFQELQDKLANLKKLSEIHEEKVRRIKVLLLLNKNSPLIDDEQQSGRKIFDQYLKEIYSVLESVNFPAPKRFVFNWVGLFPHSWTELTKNVEVIANSLNEQHWFPN